MKLTLSTFSCRILVLLAILAPATLMASQAQAATVQPETFDLKELESSSSTVNFAPNTAEKLQLLLPEDQLQARVFVRENGPSFVRIKRPFVRENGPSFVRHVSLQPLESVANSGAPSAVDVFAAIANQATLG